MDRRTADAVAALARRIRSLEGGVAAAGRASQAGYRSVEGPQPVRVYDEDGVLRSRWGVQPDGSVTQVDLGGDPPDTPSVPIIESTPGALVITWDGYDDADEQGWGANFAGVRVHLSTEDGFLTEDHDPVAFITSPTGGTVTYALPVETAYFVRLVAVTTSGVVSVPSAQASGVPQPNGDKNYYAPTEPLGLTAADDGASWYDTDDDNRHYRWDGGLLDWVPVDIGVGTLRVPGNLTVDMQLTGGEVIGGNPAGARASMGSYGFRAYGPTDNLTFDVDSTTGDVTVLGELGTALPGDIGIFLFSTTTSNLGQTRTRPTIQLNVGAGVKQPQVFADSVAGSGLFADSGYGATQREAHLTLDQGLARLWIDAESGSGTLGAHLDVANDYLRIRSRFLYGPDNYAATIDLDEDGGVIGYRTADNSRRQGVAVSRTSEVRVLASGGLMVRNPDDNAWRAVQASSFDVMSDRASKTDVSDVRQSALGIVREAPAYEWRYLGDDPEVRRVGPMADDLPEWVTGTMVGTDPDAPPMRSLSLATQVGLLWGAVQELSDQLLAVQIQGPNLFGR